VVARYRSTYAAGWDTLREQRHERMIALGIVSPKWPLSPRDPRVQPWETTPYRAWHQHRMAVYAAQIDVMDRGIGRILEKLRQLDAERDTLVIFLSDNGACDEEISALWKGIEIPEKTPGGRAVQSGNNPNLMPGGADTFQSYGIAWANASNTPFRLYKGDVHEGGIATPMIVRWPGGIPDRGKRIDQIGHLIDIVPTCVEAAKMRYPARLAGYKLIPPEGQSLLPIFRGQAIRRGPLFWEYEGNRAVRDGKWKLVAGYGRPWELYDMEADRTELRDQAAEFPLVVKELSQQYDAWAARCNVEPWRK
jgi:arylsulfatase